MSEHDHRAAGDTQRRSYHHGDLRAQLLVVVRGLIETHGPDGVSLAQAAREAGVSTGAPYRHFKDKSALLEAVVADAMERLRAAMLTGRDAFPSGSLEAICGTGQAYIDVARAEPGVFRLMFGLTEGHEASEELKAKGSACFGVVLEAAARYLQLDPADPVVSQRAYMLWAFVHGHSFLMIDKKHVAAEYGPSEWEFLMTAGRGILDLSRG